MWPSNCSAIVGVVHDMSQQHFLSAHPTRHFVPRPGFDIAIVYRGGSFSNPQISTAFLHSPIFQHNILWLLDATGCTPYPCRLLPSKVAPSFAFQRLSILWSPRWNFSKSCHIWVVMNPDVGRPGRGRPARGLLVQAHHYWFDSDAYKAFVTPFNVQG